MTHTTPTKEQIAARLKQFGDPLNDHGTYALTLEKHEAKAISDHIEALAAQLAEANERTVSVSFPNHPLRGGVEREYTLDDIEPLLQRAEAAEAKLAEREAELAISDAAHFYQRSRSWLRENDLNDAEERARIRHAARQQQRASAEPTEREGE